MMAEGRASLVHQALEEPELLVCRSESAPLDRMMAVDLIGEELCY